MIEALSAIFIFTKDRPASLKQTLNSLKEEHIKICLIDDSFLLSNQLENHSIANSLHNIEYLGKKEFNNFFKSNNIIQSDCGFQINELGNQNWNLGNARNFALTLAKFYGIENALFMDDDIIVNNPTLIANSFKLLENYLFVGAKIVGMPDHSIIGHISNDLGLVDDEETTLSGGFLAFNPKKIQYPFLNIYNEDWIWLFLHSNEKKYLQPEYVFQKDFNPYIGYKEKILFQEYGEVIITGILIAKEKQNFEIMTSESFWERVLDERKTYLSKLVKVAMDSERENLSDMIKWLLYNFSIYESSYFSNCFKDFYNVKQNFKIAFNEL